MKTTMKLMAAAATLVATGSALPTPSEAQSVGPRGSYQQTCRNVRVQNAGRDDALLTADCQTQNGSWASTGMRYRSCPGDIANWDGQLSCDDRVAPPNRNNGQGYGGNTYGGGGYGGNGYGGNTYGGSRYDGGRYDNRQQEFVGYLRLYGEYGFKGPYYDVKIEATNLPKQFNDRTRSLKIVGGQAWQICQNSDFRGTCTVVDRDIPDLSQWGMADTISSARRAR